ncbi:MAG: hypothetical protein ABGZ53_26520 [Fuerstiella sp.]
MAKEPQRRYQTATELAEDLQRFLDGQPVLARRVTHAYRLRRWCGRKPRFALLSVLATTVSLVAAVSVVQMNVARDEATRQTQISTDLSDDAIDSALSEELGYYANICRNPAIPQIPQMLQMLSSRY